MWPMRVPDSRVLIFSREFLFPNQFGDRKRTLPLSASSGPVGSASLGVHWMRMEWSRTKICVAGACLVGASLLGCHRSWVQVPSPTMEWVIPLENPEFSEGRDSLSESIIGTDHSHPRFYPVPVWDPFHPPTDLASRDALTGESKKCRPPFFILPTPPEAVQTSDGPEMLPYPRQ